MACSLPSYNNAGTTESSDGSYMGLPRLQHHDLVAEDSCLLDNGLRLPFCYWPQFFC
jgi:hypothetical protein